MKNLTKFVIAAGCMPVLLFAANEITTTITLKATKGYFDVTRSISSQYTLTSAAPNASGFTQSITTNPLATAITVGDVATNGWAYFRNLTTNVNTYIDLGYSGDSGTNFYAIVRLKPGEPACFRLVPAADFYAKATGTNSILEKLIIDD